MTQEVSPSQKTEIGLPMKDENAQPGAGIVQNVGAKRRRIDAEVESGDASHHSAFPPVHSRYPHLSQRPQSTPPPSAEFSIPSPNRMITRSLSKSQSDLLNRAQTASPSNSAVSDSLRQVSSTTTSSRAFTQSSTLTLKQAGPIPRVDYGGQVRRVFSQPNFHPGSVPYHNQMTNHAPFGFAAEQTHPAVQQLHQAQQNIHSLQSQLDTSTTAIRTLESRVINSESLLSSKSVELVQARNEIQSLRFQLHQQSLGSVSRHQLNEEKSRHSKELEDMRARLGEVVKKVNSESEMAEGVKRGLREDVERLHCEIQERDQVLRELKTKNEELLKDNESVNRDLFAMKDDLAGLKEINKVFVQKVDSLSDDSKKKNRDLSTLDSENAELKETVSKLNRDITLLNASKEALNRALDTYKKTNQKLQSDLSKEKERSEEVRKVGWEQLNTLKREYDTTKNRHQEVSNSYEEIKRLYEIVCQSEKAVKVQLMGERDKFNHEKANWEKDVKSKKHLRDRIDELENDLSNTKQINVDLAQEKDRLVREVNQKERKYEEVSQEKIDLLTRLDNQQKEYDHLDIKYKEQAKLNQVSKAEVKGLKKGNATLTKKILGLEETNKAHKKDKQELNRQINLLKKEIIGRKQDHKEAGQFRVSIEDLSRTVDDLTGQNTVLQSEKQLLARKILELSESCKDLEETKRRLEERVERNDHKVEELENFVRRIILARSKYHDKIELKDGANSDSSKAQFDGLIRSYDSIWTTPNLISARERKRQDKLLKMELKRSTIPQKLNWLDYWIKLIDFALEDLEEYSIDQVSSHTSKDDHPVHD
ncbi:hypothetical protein I203_105676 [Kwoniella mangroviensis CBS 8507]|uniref:uncharacterized protein n=1 Tax=Kwoniella mangroviensis CBS 8507 TaxID=1296122 RepID=UPI00080D64E4|nr:uncharacterized protein I203_01488 [Kwoniella mangroviensis CBS 8507]OCF69624.1 hypothetical protein I203_01488 [Kwoniella mangroviensis CBS 8507]